ncbi:CAP domain-containing protein [Weissella confusa]|uniref:CAP domain-containing protein n=1 Tax=Weissella confusa TaxID=1583 RepID=UPI0018F1C1C0|nr:CAP domain-containing protein [Weissella confusa]MBJ7670883.1 KxYKxGKxW signal peptide domain-containing protein [Weissella confusa]
MELKKHYKMYKSGKQLVVAAVAAVAAGVMFAGNQSASADTWQAKSVDEVAAELQKAGDVHNYTFQEGDTVWALATALHMSVEDFSAQYSIANPEVIVTGQAVNGQFVVPVSSDATVDSDADAAASQAADESAVAASQAAADSAYAASVAAASQAAADSAYAASVAAAQEAQAESAAAASVAAAQDAQATVASDDSQTNAPAADQTATVNTPAQDNSSASVATGAYAGALNQLNAYRRAHGLAPVTLDAGLSAKAQSRAQQLAGTVDSAHWSQSYGPEVIAIQFGAGAGAIDAWYNETNMWGAPAHKNWILKASTTSVGFGYDQATGTFVGESN